MKRKAKRAERASRRRSEASAITAPAPAATPLTAAITGSGQLSKALDHRPGHTRELEQVAGLHRLQGANDLDDVASGAESSARTGDHQHARVATMRQLGEQVAKIRVDVEGERAELLRAGQRDRGNAVGDREIEVLPLLREPG